MSSVCISNCINDARDPRVPVRATYVNLYKWPESDAEFVRSVSSRGTVATSSSSSSRAAGSGRFGHPRVVDSISCRQMYLRSYKFSREETIPEKKIHKCFRPETFLKKKRVSDDDEDGDDDYGETRTKTVRKTKKKKKKKTNKCLFLEKVKDFSFAVFRRCLSCTTTVDVVVVADRYNK